MDVNDGMARAQSAFARWLGVGTWTGLALLVAGFAAYVFGVMPPHVPFAELPAVWGLPLEEFVAATGAPRGWAWLSFADRGDYLNYFGVVLLASIIPAAYLRIIPLLALRERAFALIALLEIAVLLVSASGLLNWFSGGSP